MAETTQDSDSAKVALWNDPRYRSLFFQLLLVAVVIWLFWSMVDNTITNLQKQNIASGFGFLETTAGFGIITTLIPYSETASYGRAFVVGLLNTILVASIGIVFATILGFIVGIARLAPNWVIRKMAMAYVETMRNIPLLLQIFFWYFAVLRSVPGPRDSLVVMDAFFLNNRGLIMPRALFAEGSNVVVIALLVAIVAAWAIRKWARKRQMATGEQFPVFRTALGLIVGLPVIAFFVMGAPISWEYAELKGFSFVGGLHIIPEFIALLFALSIYTAAFVAEIVRSGILAVSHGQTEAAFSLGVKPGQTLRLIVIPQALRVIIPPLTNQYLNLTKNSSLAVAIAYPDLVSVFAGTVLNQTGQAIEVIAITMAVYLAISLAIAAVMNLYNRRLGRSASIAAGEWR